MSFAVSLLSSGRVLTYWSSTGAACAYGQKGTRKTPSSPDFRLNSEPTAVVKES